MRQDSLPKTSANNATYPVGIWLCVSCYVVSTLVVFLGVLFARGYVNPAKEALGHSNRFMDSLVLWDGTYYRDIARDGYSYRPGQQSTVHFWPLYPLLGRTLAFLTTLPVEYALLIVSHLCLATALLLFARYISLRCPPNASQVRTGALLALSFLPAGFFFRMAYTESLFLLLGVSQLYLIRRQAHPLLIATVVGLAVVTRPTGISLLLPLLGDLFGRGYGRWRTAGWICLCVPVALVGFAGFLLYCGWAFDDSLAPLRNRMDLWAMRPPLSLGAKLVALLTLQPVWEVFIPGSPVYWENFNTPNQALFAIYPANPLYFLGALGLCGLGAWRGWLNRAELLFALGIVLMPYWYTGYDVAMTGMARYMSVCVPLYLVLGRLLAYLPPAVLASLTGLAAFFQAVYAGLFGLGYWFV